ncbi:MAG: hypothetical protein H6Q17_2420 [Bacteroidetes bacterium]|nr:hypothetical protein [Bacteroidota bacterium]
MRQLLLILLAGFLTVNAHALSLNDSTKVVRDTISFSLSDKKTIKQAPIDTLHQAIFKPNPSRAVWLGALVPGLGQIYNKKYWKLPIIYGGFAGLIYAISWNGRMYNDYKNAYLDITDSNPNTTSYLNFLTPSQRTSYDTTWLTSALKSKVNTFRRYRDLSVICAIGLYALSMVDAYVDAQLSDFDVSPDLSMKIAPTLLKNNNIQQGGLNASLGMKLKLNF